MSLFNTHSQLIIGHTHLHIILTQIIHNSQTILSKQCLTTIHQITSQFTTPHPKIFSLYSHTTIYHKTIHHKICFPYSNMTIHHRTLHRNFFFHRQSIHRQTIHPTTIHRQTFQHKTKPMHVRCPVCHRVTTIRVLQVTRAMCRMIRFLDS